MSLRVRFLVAAVSILIGTACATAVRSARRNEAGFFAGGTPPPAESLPGDAAPAASIDFESGVTLQAYYSRLLTDPDRPVTLHLEVPLLAVPEREIVSSDDNLPESYSALFLIPGLRIRAQNSETRLLFTGNVGAGYARFSESELLSSGAVNRSGQSVNTFGLGFGVGLGVQLAGPVDLRLEGRGVIAKRALSFDEPEDWKLHSMGFLGVGVRF